MKRLIIFLLLFAAIKVAGQTTGYLRFDTVRIIKQNGTAELYLINSTKDSLGVLTNIGGGLTRFLRSRAINDSTIVIGKDTIVIRGATGGGGSGDTTIVRAPLRVNTGAKDTLFLDYGFGLKIEPDSTLIIDTTYIATLDSTYRILSRSVVVIDTIEYVHDGSSSATYQNDKLIGAKLISLYLENYQVSFITRTGICYVSAFDSETGEITLTNGFFADDDWVKIIYRTTAIFLVDEDGNFVLDEFGNFIILN